MSKLVIGVKLGEIDLSRINLDKIENPFKKEVDLEEINRRIWEEVHKHDIARYYRIGFPYVDEGWDKPFVDEGWGKPFVDEGWGKPLVDEDWTGRRIAKFNDWSREYSEEELEALKEKYGNVEEEVRELVKRR